MLELHYPMIQFLIINLSNFFGEKNENEAFRGVCWEHAQKL